MTYKGECVTARLCIVSFGLAIGVVKGLGMMLIAWAAHFWGWDATMVNLIASSGMIHGYAATVVGGLWGALWGFITGFITGALIALIYNWVLCCCSARCKKAESKGV